MVSINIHHLFLLFFQTYQPYVSYLCNANVSSLNASVTRKSDKLIVLNFLFVFLFHFFTTLFHIVSRKNVKFCKEHCLLS